MKQKLNQITLPYIQPDRKTHHNFYSVCIKAIENNKDGVLDKAECIRKINKLREEKLLQQNKRNLGKTSSLNFNPSHTSMKLKIRTNRIINKRRNLSQIILECEKLEEQKNLKKQFSSTMINEDQNKDPNKKVNDGLKESKDINTNNIIKKKKNTNIYTLNLNKNRNKSILIKNKEKTIKNLPKRYSTFKRISEYLESNDIALFELLKHNPFQKKPYQISKGYEFLEAVKFKNYQFVKEALQTSNDYLFVFDYYGQTCYHWAAKLGDLKMLSILLDYGKHHNQKDFKGRTPLYLAAVNNNKEVCDLLLRNKANIHLRDNLGNSASDVAGSRELQYYLGDIMAQPFSNPIYKKKVDDFLKQKEKDIEEAKLNKRLKEIEKEHKIEYDDDESEENKEIEI